MRPQRTGASALGEGGDPPLNENPCFSYKPATALSAGPSGLLAAVPCAGLTKLQAGAQGSTSFQQVKGRVA